MGRIQVVFAMWWCAGCTCESQVIGTGSASHPPQDARVADAIADSSAPPAPGRARCAFDDPSEPEGVSLVMLGFDNVTFVGTDGKVRKVVAILPPDIPDGSIPLISSAHMTVANGYVLLSAVRRTPMVGASGRWSQWDRVTLLDLLGQVHWERSMFATDLRSTDHGSARYLGDDGVVALGSNGQGTSVVVWPDGHDEALPPAVEPIAPPFARAVVAVGGTAGSGFWKPGTSTITPLRFPLDPSVLSGSGILGGGPARFRDALVYRTPGQTGRLAVKERPGGTETIAIPDAVDLGGALPGMEGWEAYNSPPDVWRVNIGTGEATLIRVAFPSGTRSFDATSLTLDHTGALLNPARDDYRAFVQRSPDGISWTILGQTFLAEMVSVKEAGGTYLIDVTGADQTFSPQQTWTPPPPGLEPVLTGSSLQLLRPADRLAQTLTPNPWEPRLSVDGRCFAYRSSTGANPVHVVDTARGRTYDLPGYYNDLVFVE